ncbi:MAG: C-terminal target protein [Mucilaginibacter sp.]|nr:C-terminal target protein [Mucilaginibacter sp.]
MKTYILYLFLAIGLTFIYDGAFAAVPVISYTPSTNVYTVNTAITPLTPNNTGGAVTSGALTTFANIPVIAGQTYQPFGISFDPTTGNIITDDYYNGKIYIYSPTGALLTTYNQGTNNRDIVVDASGNIYVASGGTGYVSKITPAGVITTITEASMSAPAGLAIDASGNIFVGDWSSGKVYKIAPGATAATIYASGFTNGYGVAVNSTTGDVYVSESNPQSKIIKIASGTLTQTTLASGFNDPRNIITDAAGNIYLSDYGANKIVMITPTGTKSNYIIGLNQPRSTVFDQFGNMYIANSGGSNVMEYSANGYSIDKTLPAGMSFNTTTGVISGTPTVTSATTVYTIAAHNASGTAYATVTITVNPTAPTGTPGSVCGAGTVTLSASAGAPSGGTYSWYTASSGGSSVATGTTYSPSVSVTTTYYVEYTQGGMTSATRTAVTATVGSIPIISTAPTTGAYFSYSFTGGISTDIAGSNNGTLQGAPSAIADRYGISGNAYNFDGSSQYISTSTSYVSPGPQAFSVSVWFKTSTAGGYLVGFGSAQTGNSGSVGRVVYIGTNGKLYFGVAPGGTVATINTASAYNDGSWHHVVATFSTTNGSNMYVDGALAASNPAMQSVAATAGYWRVGYDVLTGWTNAPGTAYFNGSLDDIAVANTELTAAQVNVLYGAGSAAFCAGNTLSLTANTVSGATYSWTGPGGFTSTQQNPTVSSALAGTYILTVTSGSGCTSVLNVTAPSNIITYTWTGAAGTTDPTTAGNWDNLPLFNSTTNLVIPAGLSTYPALTVDESIFGLTLGSNASLNLNGHTLNVGCNIINNATTSGKGVVYGANNSSGITWNGSVAAQSYTGTNTITTAQLGTMTVNNSAGGTVTINGGPIDIFNLLTMTNGNLVVSASPAALTLKSSSTLTATVEAIPATCAISGNVNVERYISGGSNAYRGYRLLSCPVYTAKVGSNYYFDLSNYPLYMPVTGTLGASGGLTRGGNPTIYLYRDDRPFANNTFNTYNFRGVNKVNNSPLYSVGVDFDGNFNLHPGTGLFVFYRGNLNNLASKYITTTSAESTVLVSTGTLNQQAVTVVNWYTQLSTLQFSTVTGNSTISGYNLVGNPYASSIDWDTYSTTNSAAGIYAPNVSSTIYIYNAVSKIYATYNAGIGVNGGSHIIPSGQGFFVRSTATGASLTFNEAAKTNAQVSGPTQSTGNTLLLSTAPVATNVLQYIRLEMAKDSVNKEETVLVLNNGAKDAFVINEDSPHFAGGGLVALSSLSADNITLAINRFPVTNKGKTIKLKVFAGDGTYQLNLTELKAIPQLFDVWLMDAYAKDSLDLRHNLSYTFKVNQQDTASFGTNRFTIVIRQNPALGVHLLDFTATQVTGGAQVNWKTENEQNYTNFTVERSTDKGLTFNAIGGFISSAQGTYGLLDQNPANGYRYRLKLDDLNGTVSYSKVVTLQYSAPGDNTLVSNNIIVYPNPSTGIINVALAGVAKTNPLTQLTLSSLQAPATVTAAAVSTQSYKITIVNSNGAVIKTTTSNQPDWQDNVSSLLPGTYLIQVVNNKDKSLVGKGKFVKL